jgi:hypothetical protein
MPNNWLGAYVSLEWRQKSMFSIAGNQEAIIVAGDGEERMPNWDLRIEGPKGVVKYKSDV